MKTVLVTGGAGFVGSHACKALSRAGHLPVTFDNLERGHERAVKTAGARRRVRGTATLGRDAFCSLYLRR
jgi:UDP-glucose 4-epimerase